VSHWLSDALSRCELTEDVEGYLLGRGALERSYRELGCVTWQVPFGESVGDEAFDKRYGPPKGLNLEGWLVCPIYSPKGKVIGFEARNTREKALSEYVMPEGAWNPLWLGLCPAAMERIWAGGDVWIGEGLFDKFPMEWAVPEADVVLATLRARLTDKHVEFLRRFCRGWVHMVYDLDVQGRKATHGWTDPTGKYRWGALDKLRRVDVKCRDVPYTGGKDPGEVWDKGGAAGIRAAFRMTA
jgi:hypothetical protein